MCVSPTEFHPGKPAPCGTCPECKARLVSSWSFRLMQHQKSVMSAYFITLTYDTKHVPITGNSFMQLSIRDVQLFIKRLRKSHHDSKFPLKYFAVGEYGGKTMRPHYHVIMFNADIQKISKAWDLGHVHYGSVNEASVGYTLKYMMKPGKIPLHKNDDRQPEFRLMSKKLGINYLTPAVKKWHHNDMYERMYCTIDGGKKISMPRYYKDKLYTKPQREAISQHQLLKRNQEAANELQEQFDKGVDALKQKKDRQDAAYRTQNKNSKNRDKL